VVVLPCSETHTHHAAASFQALFNIPPPQPDAPEAIGDKQIPWKQTKARKRPRRQLRELAKGMRAAGQPHAGSITEPRGGGVLVSIPVEDTYVIGVPSRLSRENPCAEHPGSCLMQAVFVCVPLILPATALCSCLVSLADSAA
jgi:hypothetical protein